jgi:hypothetical protein
MHVVVFPHAQAEIGTLRPGEKGIHDPRFYTWENTGSIQFSIYRCRKTGVEQFRPQDSGLIYQAAVANEPGHRRARSDTPVILYGT